MFSRIKINRRNNSVPYGYFFSVRETPKSLLAFIFSFSKYINMKKLFMCFNTSLMGMYLSAWLVTWLVKLSQRLEDTSKSKQTSKQDSFSLLK